MASKLIFLALFVCAATAATIPASSENEAGTSGGKKESLDTANSIGFGYGLYNGGLSAYNGAGIGASLSHPGYAGYGAYGLGYTTGGHQGFYAGYPYTAGYGGFAGNNGYYGGLGYQHGLSGVY